MRLSARRVGLTDTMDKMKILHKNGKVVDTNPRVAKVLFLLGLAQPTITPEVTEPQEEKPAPKRRARKQPNKKDS